MLSRRHRFHGHTSLSGVYRRGSTVRNQQLAIRYLHNPRRDDYRVAIIVSRKVHKSAVKRNRVRRRISEIIRQQAQINGPYDIIISVFSEQIVDTPPTELATMILKLLRKGHISNGNPRAANQHGIVDSREERQ
jgi:ribonuclease P protein component